MKKRVFLILCLLFMTNLVSAFPFMYAQVAIPKVSLSSSPEILGSSGWVTLNISDHNLSGDWNIVLGFEGGDVYARSPEVYQVANRSVGYTWKYEDVIRIYEFFNVVKVEEVDSKTVVTYSEGEGKAAFNVTSEPFELVKIIEQNQTYFKASGKTSEPFKKTVYDTVSDYDSLGVSKHVEETNLYDMVRWDVLDTVSLSPGVDAVVRVWVELEDTFPGLEHKSGKYSIGIIPAGKTVSDSESEGSFYVLDPWFNASWAFRIKLTFNNTASVENLVNFTVHVHLNSSRVDFSEILSDGDDIRFVESDNVTVLSAENESWNDTSNEADIWVLVPQIDAGVSTDHIWMYYGNPTASSNWNPEDTWNDEYEFVHHLQEDTNTTSIDSTSNNNDGTPSPLSSPPIQTVGAIDGALDFDGDNDFIDISHKSSLDFIGNWTIIAQILPDNVSQSMDILSKRATIWQHIGVTSAGKLRAEIGTTNGFFNYVGNAVISLTSISYVAYAFDNSSNTMSFFINGNLDDIDNVDAGAPLTFGNDLFFGGYRMTEPGSKVNEFDGMIDEVRLSNLHRSANWTNAQYLSMSDTYITYGAADQPGPDDSLEPSEYVLHNVPWFDLDWEYRRHITVNSSLVVNNNEDQTIALTFNDTVIDWNHVQTDGDDIRFVFLQNPLVVLSYDLEVFSYNNSVTATVTLPFVSNERDVGFILYYGNPFADDASSSIDNSSALQDTHIWGDLYRILIEYRKPSDVEISSGLVNKWSRIHKFGVNDAVGTSYEDIWPGGGDYTFLDTAAILNVSSSDADDTDGGTGAWNVTIFGLDSNYIRINETVQMSGATNVSTTQTFLRVNRAYVIMAGASSLNEGLITISAPTADQALIIADHGQTLQMIYTVPAGCSGYIASIILSSNEDKSIEYELLTRGESESWRVKDEIFTFRQSIQIDYVPARRVVEKTDVRVRSQVGVTTGDVAAGIDFYLVEGGFEELITFEIVRVDGPREYGSPLDIEGVLDMTDVNVNVTGGNLDSAGETQDPTILLGLLIAVVALGLFFMVWGRNN